MKKMLIISLLMAGMSILLGSFHTIRATDLTTIRVAHNLDQPIFAASPPDDKDRLFIVEQKAALIKILYMGILLDTPFLDLSDRVGGEHAEQGLLGLAFHPNFEQNGFFFVSYTTADDDLHIVRYQASPLAFSTDPNSGVELLTIVKTLETNNGGALAFGPDGYLYIATGDGSCEFDPDNNAQNGLLLLGKILRLDVDSSTDPYGIPASNPFLNSSEVRAEIWSLGLRNPNGLTFDRLTGELFVADVGQENFEEINSQPALQGGYNYGWVVFEGSYGTGRGELSREAPAVSFPFYEYAHESGRSWVIGGYVYRGVVIPDLQETYFFADRNSGELFSMKYGTSGQAVYNRTEELIPTDNNEINKPTAFAENAEGEMFILDSHDGEVYKIVAAVPDLVLQLVPTNPGVDNTLVNLPTPARETDSRISDPLPPFIIPAQGGTIYYSTTVSNPGTPTERPGSLIDFWTNVVAPNGSVDNLTLQQSDVLLMQGESTGWNLILGVPESLPAGEYILEGHVGNYPEEPWFTSEIQFTKLGVTELPDPNMEWLDAIMPSRVELLKATPNPFNPETSLSFALPQAAQVTLTVFDVSGRQIATLVNGWTEAGVHRATFNGSNLSTGVYLYRLQAEGVTSVGKMMLIK
jgi:glucose/arabinose dehydrogenase